MQWNRWYATKRYLRSSLWVVSLIALVLENAAIRLLFALHAWLEWVPWVRNDTHRIHRGAEYRENINDLVRRLHLRLNARRDPGR
jgi:hypothetical protein